MSASCDEVLPWIKPGWVGVEIGVCEGHSAKALIEHGCRFLYLIDPWENYDGFHGRDTQEQMDFIFRECRYNLRDYDDGRHFAILRMPSAEAVNFIPQVDFVWVDGNHRYEWVKSDLEFYWPKVKLDGVLCGHDYVTNETCGVALAVDEFAANRSRQVELALPSWVIRKVVL